VGENLSTYVIARGGLSFADFDAHTDFARTNRDRWLANDSQHVASISSRISVTRPDLSRPPQSTQTTNMVWGFSIKLALGVDQEFEYALKRIREGLQKANWPARYIWRQAVMGQSGPTYSLIIQGTKWVDFNPPSTPMEAALEKAFGKQGAMELIALVGREGLAAHHHTGEPGAASVIGNGKMMSGCSPPQSSGNTSLGNVNDSGRIPIT